MISEYILLIICQVLATKPSEIPSTYRTLLSNRNFRLKYTLLKKIIEFFLSVKQMDSSAWKYF